MNFDEWRHCAGCEMEGGAEGQGYGTGKAVSTALIFRIRPFVLFSVCASIEWILLTGALYLLAMRAGEEYLCTGKSLSVLCRVWENGLRKCWLPCAGLSDSNERGRQCAKFALRADVIIIMARSKSIGTPACHHFELANGARGELPSNRLQG